MGSLLLNKTQCLGFQQDTPWTTHLQSEGTPGNAETEPQIEVEDQRHCPFIAGHIFLVWGC